MPAPTPHRTPLRRVSQGSLLALSRSGAHHQDAPHGLGFLEPALAELADEAEALRGNVEGLRALSTSLKTFNEAFSSWLYEYERSYGGLARGPNGSVLYPCTAEGQCILPY
ncbi:hypothetical protein EDB83DRAFT_2514351 [Lactarius deliciosus]|nr:hypothetical protein EDB83DRAFT_2514351 [Lactarius deliciosus]